MFLWALRYFTDKPIDRHNFKLNSLSPGAGLFSIGTHVLLNLMHDLHHCRKLMQIRCQKGPGTKMHTFSVGFTCMYQTVGGKNLQYCPSVSLYTCLYRICCVRDRNQECASSHARIIEIRNVLLKETITFIIFKSYTF